MELELGLKFTRNVDDNVHTTDFRMAKDRGGPMFITRETETMFVLAAHLRGYRRNDIEIDINEDATLITISGEKAVQEFVMKGLIMHKYNEIEIKRFVNVFRIPQDVILDQIQAKFNEHDSTLRIYMPKLHKGIVGGVIEEIKCQRLEEHSRENQQADNVANQARKNDDQVVEEANFGSEKGVKDDQEASCIRSNINDDGKTGEIIHEDRNGEQSDGQNELQEDDNKKPSYMCFAPCFLIGGALIASLVLLCNFVRLKRR